MVCIHESKLVEGTETEPLKTRTENNMDDCDVPEMNESEAELLVEEFTNPISYVSTLPSSFFPCLSDEVAINDLILSTMSLDNTNSTSVEQMPIVGIDAERTCEQCSMLVLSAKGVVQIARVVALHTLHFGSLLVRVVDLKCERCNRSIPYDSVSDVLFSSQEEHLFTRERLDAWSWDVCGTGGTFRDAFYSWITKNCMTSASCHRLGSESNIAQQIGNEAFSAFLMTLTFPKNQGISNYLGRSSNEVWKMVQSVWTELSWTVQQ